jgi:nucleotide-binding universal stress UspA family protein
MYKNILIALENSEADRTVLEHVQQLATLTGASLLLVHVADGWVARNYDELALRESEEMKEDRAYLGRVQEQLVSRGFDTRTYLATGEPSKELVRVAAAEHVDLIAMSTHGHRLLNDIIRGSTADRVRHNVSIPVLMIKARDISDPAKR